MVAVKKKKQPQADDSSHDTTSDVSSKSNMVKPGTYRKELRKFMRHIWNLDCCIAEGKRLAVAERKFNWRKETERADYDEGMEPHPHLSAEAFARSPWLTQIATARRTCATTLPCAKRSISRSRPGRRRPGRRRRRPHGRRHRRRREHSPVPSECRKATRSNIAKSRMRLRKV
jgi:hypothetical protein